MKIYRGYQLIKLVAAILIYLAGASLADKIQAQGAVWCSTSFSECAASSEQCDPGYVKPCISGDCCYEYYYQHNNTCPISIPCVSPSPTYAVPTPIVTFPPTPTGGNVCPGPRGTYCGPGFDCFPNQSCDTSNAYGLPAFCTGRCISGSIPNPSMGPPQKVCEFLPDGQRQNDCQACFDAGNAWTAIGCVETEPSAFISRLLIFGMGIAGGIAFLLILLGGFQILTSTGNPEKLNAGKELVVSAISGLLLIIFSIFLLRLIGYDILGIPGWGV